MELLSAASSSRLDAAARAEIQSLQQETDPALAAESWLAFAVRQERSGGIETAAEIYANAVGAVGEGPLQRDAQARLDAILGRGPFGARFECLARNFAAQAADPAMLAGMGAAATVSSLVRLGALSRLLAAPAANLLTRGAGARRLAAGLAFAPEVGAFWGASRLANAALGREQAWDAGSVSREFASLGLGLGLLKLGGWASRGLFDRVHGITSLGGTARLPALASWSRPLAEQAGLFAGIGLAHVLETRLGLRPAGSEGGFWSDSLATLLQFHVGGRLSRELLGPRHAAWMQGLALRTRGLEAPGPARGGAVLEGLRAGLGIFSHATTPEGLRWPVPGPERGPGISNVLMMSGLEGDTANPSGAGSGVPKRRESNGSAEQQRRLIVRIGVERRIEAGDPEYFTPERLGMRLSRLRRGFFTRSEHARIQHAIRRYLDERGLATYPLDHPLVQERIAQVWRNPRADAAFSERFEATLREIERARETLEAMSFADGTRFEPSRFHRSEGLSQELGTEFFFLNDAARPTGSFKERGALVEVHRVAQAGALHVVTASHGNHGLAVALAARKLGLRSTIVVPDTTPQVKQERLRGLGATVVTTGEQPWRGYEEARDWALRYVFERNLYLERNFDIEGAMRYVHGFEDVIPGQGVAGFEILAGIRALPESGRERLARATFLLPTGGGGLTAGVGTVLRRHLPEARVIAVVSAEAPALHFSLMEGRRSEVYLNEKGLCDSGIGLTIPGARPFELLREGLHGSLAVGDGWVGEAMRRIHRHEGLVVEGSAATGLAAVLSGRLPELGADPKNPVVTILTGSNIDLSRHREVLAEGAAPFSGNGNASSRK